MARIWKTLAGHRDPDPEAVRLLEQSEQRLAQVNSRGPLVAHVTNYLSARREQNHFGEQLTIAFTPRRRHV